MVFVCLDFGYMLYANRRQQGVSIGGGIGSMCDIVDAAQLICEKVDISCSIAEDIAHLTFYELFSLYEPNNLYLYTGRGEDSVSTLITIISLNKKLSNSSLPILEKEKEKEKYKVKNKLKVVSICFFMHCVHKRLVFHKFAVIERWCTIVEEFLPELVGQRKILISIFETKFYFYFLPTLTGLIFSNLFKEVFFLFLINAGDVNKPYSTPRFLQYFVQRKPTTIKF